MFKDLTKFNYTPCVNAPYVLVERDKTLYTPSPFEPVLDKMLMDLLAKIRPKRASWVFKYRSERVSVPDDFKVTRVDFYKDDEHLGYVAIDTDWRGTKRYVYDNHRLKRQRHRGSHSETTKLSVVLKRVLEEFYPLDIEEIAGRLRASAMSEVRGRETEASAKWRNSVYSAQKELVPYIIAHWDALKAHVADPTVAAISFTELRRNLDEAEEMVRQLPKGHVVEVRGAEYIVAPFTPSDSFQPAGATYTHDTLPTQIREKLALLKLVDPGTHAPDTGVRLTATTFFVVQS